MLIQNYAKIILLFIAKSIKYGYYSKLFYDAKLKKYMENLQI